MPVSATSTGTPISPASAREDEPNDGWPSRLVALRAELDRLDAAIHDLLLERSRVVERVARAGKRAALRPGREAIILRRLLERHQGKMSPQAIVRIWRELLAGTTAMQGPFVVAVCDPAPGAILTQLAREHFGALTPLRTFGTAAQAIDEIVAGLVSVAVLPFPSDLKNPGENWWPALLNREEPRVHVIARLPFWAPRPEGSPAGEALVVALASPDPSGNDRSVLAVELRRDLGRTKLVAELAVAGLNPRVLVSPRREPGARIAHALLEVEGYLTEEDIQRQRLPAILLGAYAVPLDRAGL